VSDNSPSSSVASHDWTCVCSLSILSSDSECIYLAVLCTDLYIGEQKESERAAGGSGGLLRKSYLNRRLLTTELELTTNTLYTVVVTNSRPAASGAYVMSVTTEHTVHIEAISPPADQPTPEQAALMQQQPEGDGESEGGLTTKKAGPCCYISGKAADYTVPHAHTDHGFVFGQHRDECEQASKQALLTVHCPSLHKCVSNSPSLSCHCVRV
jgi:hypothetical protein